MNATATSIFYYSFYMLGMGLGLFIIPNFILGLFGFAPTDEVWVLFIIPNFILGLFGFAPTDEVWVRVLGLLAFCTGILYFYCARTNQTGFFYITVPERVIFFLGTVALVVFFDTTPLLAVIGSVDLFGAIWTGLTLRGTDT
jgi:hypothetical protein